MVYPNIVISDNITTLMTSTSTSPSSPSMTTSPPLMTTSTYEITPMEDYANYKTTITFGAYGFKIINYDRLAGTIFELEEKLSVLYDNIGLILFHCNSGHYFMGIDARTLENPCEMKTIRIRTTNIKIHDTIKTKYAETCIKRDNMLGISSN